MNAAAGLLVLALLGPPPARTYTWRDAAGQTHITSTPPPAGAELLEPPPPPAVEPGRPAPPLPRQDASGLEAPPREPLSPAQQLAWTSLDQHLARARAGQDQRTLVAVADSLLQDSLWGHGLWLMPLAPVVALALLGLLGWWFALGLPTSLRPPVVGGALLLGLAFGHLLLTEFLYQPQAVRLQRNLELLELHLGTGRAPGPTQRALLRGHYRALEAAATLSQPPWRFPGEVRALRASLKQVMVEP